MLAVSNLFQILLALLLIYAACVDIIKFNIANWLVLACAALFVVAALASPGPVNWLSHLAASALMLAFSLLLININFMGGGDLKLLSALCLWTGLEHMLVFLAAVFIAGGLLALLLIVARAIAARGRPDANGTLPRVLQKNGPVPYGVAIAAGAIYLMLPL
ncbi:MAG: peptidase [Alphaproteobacteria bacterium]|nr:MAG: peptidase [Alphaproteobacteria bacterium]